MLMISRAGGNVKDLLNPLSLSLESPIYSNYNKKVKEVKPLFVTSIPFLCPALPPKAVVGYTPDVALPE